MTMNPLRLLVLLVSLPLLLGGCGGENEPVAEVKPEEPVAETKPKTEGVNGNELEYREGIYHLKDSDTPYTGKVYSLYENGQKYSEENYKDGKENGLQEGWHENGRKWSEENWKDGVEDGLHVDWHENGQKRQETNYKDGERISEKWWNSKGEPVDTYEEALEE